MGGECARSGKYVYFLIAGLIILALSGCATVKTVQEHDRPDQSVQSTPAQPEESQEGEDVQEEAGQQDLVIPTQEPSKKEEKSNDAPHYLLLAQRFMEKGNFEASLDASQKSLSRSGKKSPGDEALFHMGLVFAHYNNPKKDYKKSISFFERIIKEYPKSPLAEQARIWIAVLNMIEQSKQVDIQIEEMKKELLQK